MAIKSSARQTSHVDGGDEIKTYRAKSMQEALQMISRELGPDASVLHSREVGTGLLRWLGGGRQVEVVASNRVQAPSRFAQSTPAAADDDSQDYVEDDARDEEIDETLSQDDAVSALPAAEETDFREQFRRNLQGENRLRKSLVEELCRNERNSQTREMPQSLVCLYTSLVDADLPDEIARDLVERVRREASAHEWEDTLLLKSRIARLLEEELHVFGPVRITSGKKRLVALVGPTGVGKTTTIAKLAANFRLREQRRVGMITVDTYRIAAVEQLRTYADIMDLPMEVVSTPRELRDAIQRLSHLDLILMDTAGRSPRDEVQIQELKSMLAEAKPDEVHLVLSAVSNVSQLQTAAANFERVGVTSLTLTKLDETFGLGNVLPLLRSSRLPLSYVTNGQNVPDDIEPADKRKLARAILGLGS